MSNGNPQLEDGYSKIANDLLEDLASFRISGEAWQMLLVIIRYTYGYGETSAPIPTRRIMKITGLSKSAVGKQREYLEGRNIIEVDRDVDPNQPLIYSLQKYKEAWQRVPKKGYCTQKGIQKGTPKRVRGVPNKVGTLKKGFKDINKETSQTKKEFAQEVKDLANLLYRLILKRDSGAKKPSGTSWLEAIDKLHRIDGRDFADIRAVIEWCQVDGFWQNNILSGTKLRIQYQQVWLKMQEDGKPVLGKDIPEVAPPIRKRI